MSTTARPPIAHGARLRERLSDAATRLRRLNPELVALVGLSGLLYLWSLSRNGWANTYYAAAVRSMSTSWHDFLYGSFDSAGVMTVDKPPLALWVQALSVRVFGFDSLAILVPQALMGVASVVLVYDLTRRRWGRWAGGVAGLAMATTPIAVAIFRHNNPDALLVLCTTAALWFTVRALEDGRTRWLVWAGVVHDRDRLELAVSRVVKGCLTIRGVHNYAPRHLQEAVAFVQRAGTRWPLADWVSPPVPLRALDRAFALAQSGRWLRVAVSP